MTFDDRIDVTLLEVGVAMLRHQGGVDPPGNRFYFLFFLEQTGSGHLFFSTTAGTDFLLVNRQLVTVIKWYFGGW